MTVQQLLFLVGGIAFAIMAFAIWRDMRAEPQEEWRRDDRLALIAFLGAVIAGVFLTAGIWTFWYPVTEIHQLFGVLFAGIGSTVFLGGLGILIRDTIDSGFYDDAVIDFMVAFVIALMLFAVGEFLYSPSVDVPQAQIHITITTS